VRAVEDEERETGNCIDKLAGRRKRARSSNEEAVQKEGCG
jgi:hypothetical protein